MAQLLRSIVTSSKSFIKANSRLDVNRKKSQPKIDRLDSLRGSCSDSLFHETFGPLSNVRFVIKEQTMMRLKAFTTCHILFARLVMAGGQLINLMLTMTIISPQIIK